jgi:hypothetical protein
LPPKAVFCTTVFGTPRVTVAKFRLCRFRNVIGPPITSAVTVPLMDGPCAQADAGATQRRRARISRFI